MIHGIVVMFRGALCVRVTVQSYYAPEATREYWAVKKSSGEPTVGDVASFDSSLKVWRCQSADDIRWTGRVWTGESRHVETIPTPCPNVRKGVVIRYAEGGWQKRSGKGWVDLPSPEAPPCASVSCALCLSEEHVTNEDGTCPSQAMPHYAALVQASAIKELPLSYRTDLTRHDLRQLVHADPGNAFGWVLRSSGTNIIRVDDYDDRGSWAYAPEKLVRAFDDGIFYWWDGRRLLECHSARTFLDNHYLPDIERRRAEKRKTA